MFSLFFVPTISAQKICLKVIDQPLNEVFHNLHKSEDLNFSFSDNFLSTCIITDTISCETADKLVSKLVKSCGLLHKKSNDIYVIYPSTSKEKPPGTAYNFSGTVKDRITNEPLPYSNIKINKTRFITNENGQFSYKSKDSLIHLNITYIGFETLDTLIPSQSNQAIYLTLKTYQLKTVVIKSKDTIQSPTEQPNSGLIKLNHQVATFVPGNNSNTLYNLLRLQPGLLASGEQTNDFLIWGSTKGQSQLIYDDITLFSVGSFNDNIGAVNPMMIKDIEVYKAGYNVNIGDRVGGLINLTGKKGNQKKAEVDLQLNQFIGGARISVPIKNNLTLQGAFRHSYFDAFSVNEKNDFHKNGFNTYDPDYKFQDYNLKLNWAPSNGDQFQLSTLSSDDNQAYEIKGKDQTTADLINSHKRLQRGISASYHKNHDRIGVTKITVAHSQLSTTNSESTNLQTGNTITLNTNNEISEYSLKLSHYFPVQKGHKLNIGTNLIYNSSNVLNNYYGTILENNSLSRVEFLTNDNISISKKVSLEPGLKIDIPLNLNRTYAQPRIKLFLFPNSNTTINIRSGLYNQFTTENYLYINDGSNITGNYQWGVADNNTVRILSSWHNVIGASKIIKGFKINLEAYYKKTLNNTSLLLDTKDNSISTFYHDSKTYGLDFLLKKQFKRLNWWLGYNLSKTEELHQNFTGEYTPSPHDQTHEIKTAVIIDVRPFFLSMNYVFGSGLNYNNQITKSGSNYNRFDVGLIYKVKLKKLNLETGLSILNLFNTKNLKYRDNTKNLKDESYFSSATSFTPILFLNIKY